VDSETLGKPAGTDSRGNKSTYVSVLGLDGAREELRKTHQIALESAARLGDNSGFLLKLADFVVNRSY
jgi:geranylgeranyl pyrophosphate synthase